MSDRSAYSTLVPDHFPDDLEIAFGIGDERQTLRYRKTRWTIDGEERGLRYGENPDQEAALYRLVDGSLELGEVRHLEPGRPLASDVLLRQSGKHPGKINITDVDSALNMLRYLADEPACVIVKHNNPSGVALGTSAADAWQRAYDADRIAAFGGVVALNQPVDRELAELVAEHYAEVIVAPSYEEGALEVLARRRNLRVMEIGRMDRLEEYAKARVVEFRHLIDGGLVAQWSFDPRILDDKLMQPARTERNGVVHEVGRAPDERERRDMRFGWFVEAGVTSNSVIYVKDGVTVAIGTGEQDRVGVARIARDKAVWKLADRLAREACGLGIEELRDEREQHEYRDEALRLKGGLSGSVMVSDAFFPFRDGADVGLRMGVSAIVQPGGSVRDHEVIDAVNEYGATMVFTGQRSFRH